MGTTVNKPTESLNLILKPLKYMQGEEAVVVCVVAWCSSGPCFHDTFYWHSFFSLRWGGLWPAKVPRKGWRPRCVRGKRNHKSSNTLGSQHHIALTIHSPWLGEAHTGTSSQWCCSDTVWLSSAKPWHQSGPSLSLLLLLVAIIKKKNSAKVVVWFF